MRPSRVEKPLTLVVLQPTSLCNLNCTYCYVPGRLEAARMPDEILDAVFTKTLGSPLARSRRFEFLWHAGEPLTVGVEYFEKAVDKQKAATRGEMPINAVQTNGVLIDHRWTEFFKRNEFKVGISIDGPGFLHDAKRRKRGGQGSLKDALRGFHLLQDHGVEPAALAVLTRESLDYPDEIFSFFLENDIWSFGFNVEEVENQHTETSFGVRQGGTLPAWLREKYRAFFSRLFDLWWPLRGFVSIREIHDVIHGIQWKLKDPSYQRQPDESTRLGIITIAKNGDMTTFSPEFAGAEVPEFNNFVVGNILSIKKLEDILSNSTFRRLERLVERGRRCCAESCLYFDLCGSAFISNRYFETGSIDRAESMACVLQRKIVSEVILEKLKSPLLRAA